MGFLVNILKNAPKLKGWLTIGLAVLASLQEIVDKINDDKDLPNIK